MTGSSECCLVPEYRFKVNNYERIADLAAINNKTGEVKSFIEIKYDDHKNSKNSAQVDDYISYCKKNNCKFVYLTQYYPLADDIEKINESGNSHMLFSEFADRLCSKHSTQLAMMFVEHLSDKGLMMKKIDSSSLYKYLVRLFNPISGHNKIQKNSDMIEGIPSSFSTVMNN
ncbi:MAG: hypothetical protein OEW87_09150, partial [Flavobacteriaceae bacterium]|nr:hypothetical protein [Flavobacteriaceae bacterium]